MPTSVINDTLMSDKEIAKALSVSIGWVRKERHNRRHGTPHTLTVDPVMIGASPRYRLSDFQAWLNGLDGGANDRNS